MKKLWCLFGMLCMLASPVSAQSRQPLVDLVLVLAVDASRSMTAARWNVQIAGYAKAFEDPEVLSAIRSGRDGAIAVTMVAWSGMHQQRQMGSWQVIRDRESAWRYASMIAEVGRPIQGELTNIAAAVDFSQKLIENAGFRASYGIPRKVIDISGDGVQNEYMPIANVPRSYGPELLSDGLAEVRKAAEASGITINGLPVKARPGDFVELYYRSEVITGPDAFVIAVEDPNDVEVFARAIRRKLILEIAARPGGARG